MTYRPTISVIIPVFNGSNFLAEALESAIEQDYDSKEIIVINDGSNDDGKTEEIALSYKDEIIYLNKENGGVASALNLGIQNAKGDCICWLSHDDIFPEDRILNQIDYFNDHEYLNPERTILYGDIEWIDKNSKLKKVIRYPDVPPNHFYGALLSGVYFYSTFKYGIFGLNGCTTLIPKMAFMEMGFFKENLKTTQDYDMWFRLNRRFNFVHMSKVLLRSRVHSEMGTIRLKSEMREEIDEVFHTATDLYEKRSEKFDLIPSQAAFGLKRDPRKRKAFKRMLEIAKSERKDGQEVIHILMTYCYSRTFKYFEDLLLR